MRRLQLLLWMPVMVAASIGPASGQQPVDHRLVDANQPPGVAAFMALLDNPQWAALIQPVRIRVPDGATVSYWNGGAFVPASHPAPVLGLSVGPVARIRVNFLKVDRDLEVYPSIELINRLNPPPELALRFPVDVVLTADDLVQAASGRIVTRVVYVENPDTALPYRQTADNQAFIELGGMEEPLAAAARLGRPIAIVRLGSRVPVATELDTAFLFGGAPLQEFPPQFVEPAALPQGSRNPAGPAGVRNVAWERRDGDAGRATASDSAAGRDHSGFLPRDQMVQQGPMSWPRPIGSSQDLPTGADPYGSGFGGNPCGPNPCGPDPCQTPSCCLPSDAGRFRFSVPARDEFLCDGADRNFEVLVDQNWNVYGLDAEDTVGHFDTLDGRRLVVPSNQVCIYSPRFAAVRKVSDLVTGNGVDRTFQFRERNQMQTARGEDFSSTTVQQLMPGRNRGASRPSGLKDRTRGVLSDQVVHLTGFRNTFSAYEDLQFVRYGRFSSGESARLRLGMQSAGVWQTNDGLQVIGDNLQPVVVNDPVKVQELVNVRVGDGKSLLRVCKLASRIAAEPGEDVEFTIRFDNIGQQIIGNVTIIDSLTTRLEYVPQSAECSLKADFLTERNEGESLILRWEITDPVRPGEGGLIRFRCRVR